MLTLVNHYQFVASNLATVNWLASKSCPGEYVKAMYVIGTYQHWLYQLRLCNRRHLLESDYTKILSLVASAKAMLVCWYRRGHLLMVLPFVDHQSNGGERRRPLKPSSSTLVLLSKRHANPGLAAMLWLSRYSKLGWVPQLGRLLGGRISVLNLLVFMTWKQLQFADAHLLRPSIASC